VREFCGLAQNPYYRDGFFGFETDADSADMPEGGLPAGTHAI
jgi:hypothetical protein